MSLSTPVEHLASALHHAALVAFPEERFETRDFEALYAYSKTEREALVASGETPMRVVVRRPNPARCMVVAMFSQCWGSTALGFGGVGGAAMTEAYTVAIENPDRTHIAVYWSGRWAYTVSKVDNPKYSVLLDDLQKANTVKRSEALDRYGAQVGH